MVTAAIIFTQSGVSTPAGRARLGISGAPVTLTNQDNTGVTGWSWTLESAPPWSGLVPGVLGVGDVASFNPDVDGSYGIELVVTGEGTSATARKVFSVPDASGIVIPAFNFGADAHNYDGQLRGWAGGSGSGPHKLLDAFIRWVSGVLRAFAGDVTGPATSNQVVGIQGRPVASDAPDTGDVLSWDGSEWTPTGEVEGTASPTFAIDTTNAGPVIENESGALAVRNSTDTDYEEVKALTASLTSSSITLRADALTDGGGYITVKQSGPDVLYGWVSAVAKFGVSSDGGATFKYLEDGSGPPSVVYDTLAAPVTVIITTETLITITPAAGTYLLTMCVFSSSPPGEAETVSVIVAVDGVDVGDTYRSLTANGETVWEATAQAIVTVDGTEDITLKATCDATCTIATASLTALLCTATA